MSDFPDTAHKLNQQGLDAFVSTHRLAARRFDNVFDVLLYSSEVTGCSSLLRQFRYAECPSGSPKASSAQAPMPLSRALPMHPAPSRFPSASTIALSVLSVGYWSMCCDTLPELVAEFSKIASFYIRRCGA